MIELTRARARRLAVTAAGLTSPRPRTLDEAMAAVGSITVDLTPYVAGSVPLVLWSRLGRRYDGAELERALDERRFVEIRHRLRPAADIALYREEMERWPGDDAPPFRRQQQEWVRTNRGAREQILQQLRSEGPLVARELHAEFASGWRSSGWNNDKSTTMMLERLAETGDVAVSHREGRERCWDIAERVYPDVPPVPDGERVRNERRLAVQGLARADGPDCDPGVGTVGEEARVEGVRGSWRVAAELLDRPFRGRTAILSPFDPLVQDRERLGRLWDFDYALEMYKPVSQRRWGYYALPVLHGAELVGKVDAETDRASGVLHVHAVHRDGRWSRTLAEAVDAELRSLARALELELET